MLAIGLLIWLGQGGSRAGGQPEYGEPVGDRTPDAAWKLGQFYYNPADPALIVEKRFGLGYTLNFGNRWSWVLTAALFVPLVLSIAFADADVVYVELERNRLAWSPLFTLV